MARELKLALIVGFVLVLVVTMLISDHLSKARQSRLADDTSSAPAMVPPAPEEPALALRSYEPDVPSSPLPGSEPTPAPESGLASGTPSGMPADPSLTPSGEPAPVVLALGSGTPAGDSGTLGTALNTPAAEGDVPDELARLIRERGGQIVNGEIRLPVAANTRTTTLAAPQVGVPQPAPSAPAARPETPAPAPSPAPETTPARERQAEQSNPGDRWHVVASGESAFGIARKYYGNGELWRELARYNGNRIRDNGSVRQGVRLRIPTREVLTGRASGSSSTPREVQPAPSREQTPARREQASSGARVYTVKAGDSLNLIAQRELGTVRRAGEILALNKDTLKDPNAIRAGMQLKLPAR